MQEQHSFILDGRLLKTYIRHTPSTNIDRYHTLGEMGQRQNRKRIRHRPLRASRLSLQPMPFQPMPFLASTTTMTPTVMSVRYSYASPRSRSDQSSSDTDSSTCSSQSLAREEDPLSRDLRIFGGGMEDEAGATDLRGPMLDVVLGLFDGLDYDDEVC